MKWLITIILLLDCLVACGQGLVPTRRRNFPGGAGSGGGSGITNVTRTLQNWWKLDENSGTSTADSVGSATGTLTGGPAWTNGVINFAVQATFNGTHYFSSSQRIQLAANTAGGASAMTVSAWVKMSDPGQSLYIITDGDDINKGFYFQSGYASLQDLALVIVTTGGEMVRYAVANTIQADRWIFVMGTWDGTVGAPTSHMHLYTNNVEVTYAGSGGGTGSASANNTTTRNLGGNYNSAGTFNGVLDDARLYGRVLDATERSYLYQWTGQP